MNNELYDKLNRMIEDKTNSAITMRQFLKPVEGDNAVIYPPTYAGIGYNIDSIEGSETLKNVCTIDSVGSQANRMEPIFKEKDYKKLIPQIIIEIRKPAPKGEEKGELLEEIDLLDAGHRIADAVVRFSDGANEIDTAFQNVKKGNASSLAKLSPTSLVFGCWDSRVSSVKLPRIVRSTIRAINVHKLTRSAQFVPVSEMYEETFEKLSEAERKRFADEGMGHVPSIGVEGGVILDSASQIIRVSILSLSALRSLRAGDNDDATTKLRRYLLGLSLIAFTAPQEPFLRMGCELTANPDKPSLWESVCIDGKRNSFSFSHKEAINYAEKAAAEFGVGESKIFTFDAGKAKKELNKKKNNKTEGKVA